MRLFKSEYLYIIFIFFLILCPEKVSASLPVFFNELLVRNLVEYSSYREDEYDAFCSAHGIEPGDSANSFNFYRILFLHDMLTTVSACDCARGGFLRIPYFWHWRDPNPRHRIFSMPDSVLLCEQDPPPQYGRYKTRADIDRVPTVFLKDLVSEEAGYFHTGCGSFFSFGWCSEREMSYTSIIVSWGYEGKIRQSGIHTFSAVWCFFTTDDGTLKPFVANVDNTFDSLRWQEVEDGISPEQWRSDVGKGTQILWYNQTARSGAQLEALEGIEVGGKAERRIQRLINDSITGS